MLTTQEVLDQLKKSGCSVSQKRLADYVKRGILEPPTRQRRRSGGPGSESYWPPSTVETVAKVVELRAEGLSFEKILARLHGGRLGSRDFSRISITVWMPDAIAARMKAISKATNTPVVRLLQLGARLFQEAPHRDAYRERELMAFFVLSNKDVPDTDAVFSLWASMAQSHLRLLVDAASGQLPEATLDAAYLLWRAIRDQSIIGSVLTDLRITNQPVERDGEGLGYLTVFGNEVRLFCPGSEISSDLPRCLALSQELDALPITGEGHDLDKFGGTRALEAIQQWIRKEKADAN